MPNTSVKKVAKKACIFAGPSLAGLPVPPEVDRFPPATRGALEAALASGYKRIGFIDGAIEGSDRVPLRELREALAAPGVTLLGGASMGAVRAVQLESAGMAGHGHVYRLLRKGSLTGSDEVYVLHAPAALQYRCLTLPLVNIRYTLRAMRLSGHLSRDQEHAVLGYMQDVPWFDRDRHSLSAATSSTCGVATRIRLMQTFDLMYRDIKREDAVSLVAYLRSERLELERGQSTRSLRGRSRSRKVPKHGALGERTWYATREANGR
jgi:hypothetical protein